MDIGRPDVFLSVSIVTAASAKTGPTLVLASCYVAVTPVSLLIRKLDIEGDSFSEVSRAQYDLRHRASAVVGRLLVFHLDLHRLR